MGYARAQTRGALKPFEVAIRLAFLGFLIFWALIIIRPFLGIIAGSVILAVALYPIFSHLAKWLGDRRRLAAALITTLGLLVVLGPATWLGLSLVRVSESLYVRLNSGDIFIPQPLETVKSWPLVGEQLFHVWSLASTNLKAALVEVVPQLKPLGSVVLRVARSVGTGLIYFLISVIIAGFLLSPGPSLVEALARFIRKLVSKRAEQFVQLAGATIRSVSQGVIGISILQTALVSFGLIVVGVPGAGFISFCILILCIVQIGPALIVIPIIIWCWITKETATALVFTAYMVPVNLFDNILRPIVMTRGLKTPMVVILVGVVGGTLLHGIIGLFVGPIVLAVAWDLSVSWVGKGKSSSA